MDSRKNLKKLKLTVVDQKTKCNGDTNNMIDNTCMQLYQKGPACILPNLYLGAFHNAQDIQQLKTHGINCIINVASEIKYTIPIPSINYHHIHWTHTQTNLASVEFDNAIKIIMDAHTQNQTVLIHCQQGIERSAALVLAFLLFTNGWTLDTALSFVKQKAPGIRPNMELLYQLREYEQTKQNIQTKTMKRSNSITFSEPSKLTSSTRRRRSSSNTYPITSLLVAM